MGRAQPATLKEGRYRLVRELGAGGEGRVMLAHDRLVGEDVVVKWRTDPQPGPDALLHEARTLQGLDHPHVVAVLDVFRDRSLARSVLVERWEEGRALSAESLAPGDLGRVAWQLVDALVDLHRSGLRHGDIKPANILIADHGAGPVATLIDFGMAARADDAVLPGGTPPFFAPEIRAGRPPSAAMDWYALGLTLRDAVELGPTGDDELARLMEALLTDEPELRTRLVHELAEGRSPALPSRLPLVGRGATLAAVEAALLGTAPPAAPVRLGGPEGCGRRRLLRALESRLRLRARAVVIRTGVFSLDDLLVEVAVELGTPFDTARRMMTTRSAVSDVDASAVARLAPILHGREVVVALGPEATSSPAGRRLVHDWDAYRRSARDVDSAPLGLRLLLCTDGDRDADVVVPDLDADDLAELLVRTFRLSDDDRDVARPAGDALLELTAGRARRVDRAVRAAVASGALGYVERRFRAEPRLLARLDLAGDGMDPADADGRVVLDLLASNAGALDRDLIRDLLGWSRGRVAAVLRRLVARGAIRAGRAERSPVSLLAEVPPSAEAPVWDPTPEELAARLEVWLADEPRAVLAWIERGPAAAPVSLRARAHLALGEVDVARDVLDSAGAGDAATALLAARVDVLDGDRSRAAERLTEALARDGGDVSLLNARALVRLFASDPQGALVDAMRALEGDAGAEARARAHTFAGVASLRTGDADVARDHLERALRGWVELDQRANVAACRGNLGVIELRAGRLGRARALLEDAADELERCGDADQLAAVLSNLGIVLSRMRRPDDAARAHTRAMSAFALSGDRVRLEVARASRGIARGRAGRLALALRDLGRALEVIDGWPRVVALSEQSLVLAATGRRRKARRGMAAALAAARRGEEPDRPRIRGAARQLRWWLRDALREDAAVAARPQRLRSALAAERLAGRAWSIVHAHRRGRRVRAHRRLTSLFEELTMQEQHMTDRQRVVFRAAVVDPLLRRLKAELTAIVGGESSGEVPLLAALQAETRRDAHDDLFRALSDSAPVERLAVVRLANDALEVVAGRRRDGTEVIDPSQISSLVAKEVLLHRRTVVLDDASSDDRFGFANSVRQLGLEAVVCLPVGGDGDDAMALWVELRPGAAPDEALVQRLGTAASVATVIEARFAGGTVGRLRAARRELTSTAMRLETRTRELRQARERVGAGIIVGRSEAVRGVNAMIHRIAATDLTVLVTGETGTGKELVAEAIHAESGRAAGPFVAINCSALPQHLVESELFGHVRGAFTGAVKDEPGLFRLAQGGTLFLDEIGELPHPQQAKLLRVLQEGRVRPVGGRKEHAVDVRVIAATNRELRDDDAFRQDLYYRIAGVEVNVPALRDRTDDIPLLVRHFLEQVGAPHLALEPAALRALEDWRWPGNVRELKNVAERAAILVTEDVIRLTDLPEEITGWAGERPPTLEDVERETILRALRYCEGEKKRASRILGISRSAFYEKMARLGIAK